MTNAISCTRTTERQYTSSQDPSYGTAQSDACNTQLKSAKGQSDTERVCRRPTILDHDPLGKSIITPSKQVSIWERSAQIGAEKEPQLGFFAKKETARTPPRPLSFKEPQRAGHPIQTNTYKGGEFRAVPEPKSDTKSTKECGRGLIISVSPTAKAAVGYGLNFSGDLGFVIHKGVSFVASTGQIPTTCTDKDGKYIPCTVGAGAVLGIGLNVQIVNDVCKIKGKSQVTSVDAPLVSGSITQTPDGKVNSGGLTIGTSVGGGFSITQMQTEVLDLVGTTDGTEN